MGKIAAVFSATRVKEKSIRLQIRRLPARATLRPAVCALAAFAFASAPAGQARAAEALAAVATNFAEVMDALAPRFRESTGHRLRISSGSTGKLYAQIRNGAPFDLFLAADQRRPALLEVEGAAVAGSRFTYAIGRLTLWSAEKDRIRADGAVVLRRQDFRHLAIANPKLAPYGLAAQQALTALDLWKSLQDRIVQGENVGQAFSLVATGNAELGLVALSAVLSPRHKVTGSRWDVPVDLYAPIRQDAVLLSRGTDNAAARAFLAYIKSPAAREIVARFGYGAD